MNTSVPALQPAGPATAAVAEKKHLLRGPGWWLFVGSALWWVAALLLTAELSDGDFFFADDAREEALLLAAHDGLFRVFHVLALAGTLAAATGILVLAKRLRARRPSRLASLAAGLAVVGSVVWVAEVALRMTVAVSRAHDVADGTRSPLDEPALGHPLVFAVSALAFIAPVFIAWELARRRLPGRRSSLIVAAVATLATVAGIATLAPSMIYQFGVLPLAAALILGGRRRPALPAEE